MFRNNLRGPSGPNGTRALAILGLTLAGSAHAQGVPPLCPSGEFMFDGTCIGSLADAESKLMLAGAALFEYEQCTDSAGVALNGCMQVVVQLPGASTSARQTLWLNDTACTGGPGCTFGYDAFLRTDHVPKFQPTSDGFLGSLETTVQTVHTSGSVWGWGLQTDADYTITSAGQCSSAPNEHTYAQATWDSLSGDLHDQISWTALAAHETLDCSNHGDVAQACEDRRASMAAMVLDGYASALMDCPLAGMAVAVPGAPGRQIDPCMHNAELATDALLSVLGYWETGCNEDPGTYLGWGTAIEPSEPEGVSPTFADWADDFWSEPGLTDCFSGQITGYGTITYTDDSGASDTVCDYAVTWECGASASGDCECNVVDTRVYNCR